VVSHRGSYEKHRVRGFVPGSLRVESKEVWDSAYLFCAALGIGERSGLTTLHIKFRVRPDRTGSPARTGPSVRRRLVRPGPTTFRLEPAWLCPRWSKHGRTGTLPIRRCPTHVVVEHRRIGGVRHQPMLDTAVAAVFRHTRLYIIIAVQTNTVREHRRFGSVPHKPMWDTAGSAVSNISLGWTPPFRQYSINLIFESLPQPRL
jgi:hypothetical protein